MGIKSVKIQNFKSIREAEVTIRPLNVLIGVNGSGKSNFLSFFKFINRLYEERLQLHINRNGGAESFLYFGSKISHFLGGSVTFEAKIKNEYQYQFKLVTARDDKLIFAEEWYNSKSLAQTDWDRNCFNTSGSNESELKRNDFLVPGLSHLFFSMKIFHFNDTSFNSKLKHSCGFDEENKPLIFKDEGENLPEFLYYLQKNYFGNFNLIEHNIRSIAAFFDKFYLKPEGDKSNQKISLRWYAQNSEQIFSAHNLSDGTLRMICLAVLLLQPVLPPIIIVDEPELGLHPAAIEKVAAMFKIAARKSQIIISTQSIDFLNQFEPQDVIIVDRQNNQSVFKRLDKDDLSGWLDKYTLGELWEKNVLEDR